MHELGITENIRCESQPTNANGARVCRITLEIGQLTAVMADSIRFFVLIGVCQGHSPGGERPSKLLNLPV